MTKSGIIGIGNQTPRRGERRAVIMAKQLGETNKKLYECDDLEEHIKLAVEKKKLSTGLQNVDRAYF